MKTFHVVGFCGQENPSQTVKGSYLGGGVSEVMTWWEGLLSSSDSLPSLNFQYNFPIILHEIENLRPTLFSILICVRGLCIYILYIYKGGKDCVRA